MRLLFDQNLSPRLRSTLDDIYPRALHVREAGLESADDFEIWSYARANGFVIVSKDSDFRQLSFTFGYPPKVVWIRRGNCSTSEIESLLRDRYDEVVAFHDDEYGAFLALI